MTLYINTADSQEIIIALHQPRNSKKEIVCKKIKAVRNQGEKLLPAIAALLAKEKIKLSDLKRIIVADQGSSFTSLRIGIITANTLAYALGIPVEPASLGGKIKKFINYNLIIPHYDRPPYIN